MIYLWPLPFGFGSLFFLSCVNGIHPGWVFPALFLGHKEGGVFVMSVLLGLQL
jgi:hypothetical protein